MRCAIFNFAEFLSFLVAHKIVVGPEIDVFDFKKPSLTNGIECC